MSLIHFLILKTCIMGPSRFLVISVLKLIIHKSCWYVLYDIYIEIDDLKLLIRA